MDVIFDIDGTLLDISHRLKFIQQKPKDWNAFRDPKQKRWDEPIMPIVHIFNALLADGHNVIVASARTRDEENDTRDSLVFHIPEITAIKGDNSFLIPFYMRRIKDYRKDTIVKKEMLDIMRIDGYDPVMVFDDRPSVIAMWHEQGLKVMDVRDPSKGDF
jgi:phosphoglycolate phosphatase-like HAD superfamily hydrolase